MAGQMGQRSGKLKEGWGAPGRLLLKDGERGSKRREKERGATVFEKRAEAEHI
jgi:hypothetical protein